MQRVLTAAQMRAADSYTIQEVGVSSAVLMERAAFCAAEEAEKLLPSPDAKVLIVCGGGNNGGDGFACARILSLRKRKVSICFAGAKERMSPDAAAQMAICEKLGIPMCVLSELKLEQAESLTKEAALVVDALFGIGLSREIEGDTAYLIHAVNASKAKVLAIDIPSGVDADTGSVHGCAIHANVTVTMQCLKAGLLLYPGAKCSGRIRVADIGIVTKPAPSDSKETAAKHEFEDRRILAMKGKDLPHLLPKRPKDGNKGTFGKALLIAGSEGMAGAALLCAEAFLRSGGGMVKILTHASNREILQGGLPEAMLEVYENEDEALIKLEKAYSWCDVIGIGPGIGISPSSRALLHLLLEISEKCLVLDADALNLLSEDPSLLKKAKCPVYVTPHIGEMSRLSGKSVPEIKADLIRAASEFAASAGCVCILKDARTVIAAPEGSITINVSGNSGMATAGSGDVLTGILTSMLAQGAVGGGAAQAAVCLHGAAGDSAKAVLGEYYMTARNLIKGLRGVLYKTESDREKAHAVKTSGSLEGPGTALTAPSAKENPAKENPDDAIGSIAAAAPCSRVLCEVDLRAVTHNLDVMRQHLGDSPKICAVVKANAYGHGAVPIARYIEKREDLWGFAVATAEEGEELYDAGIRKPILILGYVFPESYPTILRCGLRACIFDMESAQQLSLLAVETGETARIHIALDTGMSRIGFQVGERDAQVVSRIAELPGIVIEGLFSHFARCDEKDLEPAVRQFKRFQRFEKYLEELDVSIPIHHICNSAGIMRFPEAKRDLVRAGITLYGLTPSDEVADEMHELDSVMRVTSHISYVKTLREGARISYGGTFETKRESRIATIPVGYADGYPRMLSNKGEVLIRGKRAPILGRVCMDQFMVDVTDIPGASRGDEVVLLGKQGEDQIRAEELGAISGRFNYELVCNFTKRVPRRYQQ